MKKYIAKRLLISVVTLLIILLVFFLFLTFMPGSPFNSQKLDSTQQAVLVQRYGLKKPVIVRFFIYLKNVLKGDFGFSYELAADTSVSALIRIRLPVSLALGICAFLAGVIPGLLIGFSAAMKRGKAGDKAAMVFTVIGASVPSFVLAAVFSYFFGYRIRLLPLIYDYRHPVLSGILPLLSCAVFVMAVSARCTRDEAVKVLSSDYALFAKSQGLSDRELLSGCVVRNSLPSVLTALGTVLSVFLAGGIAVERIFNVPGTGLLLTQAVRAGDCNVFFALSFIYALIFVIARFVLDICRCIADPGARVKGEAG